jgi:oligoribonuclease
MTGLDVEYDVIIEIFCIITNGNLDIVDEEGWGAVIHQEKERMDEMVSLTNFMRLVEAGLIAC